MIVYLVLFTAYVLGLALLARLFGGAAQGEFCFKCGLPLHEPRPVTVGGDMGQPTFFGDEK